MLTLIVLSAGCYLVDLCLQGVCALLAVSGSFTELRYAFVGCSEVEGTVDVYVTVEPQNNSYGTQHGQC